MRPIPTCQADRLLIEILMEPKKPTFLIIGSAKCGTTALASILGAHPNCCMSNPKEACFFQDTMDFQTNPNYEKGWQWYQQVFNHYSGEPVVGEATPSYSDRSRSPNTAKRIYEFNPEMKIIYMVRHPLERQISGWAMQWAEGMGNVWPDRKETAWALKGFDYWMRMQKEARQWDECQYHYQIEAYLEYFPAERVLISFLEDWKPDRDREVARIMEFIGLNPEEQPANFQESANRGSDRTIDRPLLKKLRTSSLFRMFSSRVPSSWRQWARNNIAITQAVPPKLDLSEETKTEFITYVKPDAENFLKQNGKHVHYWSLG